MILKRDTFNYLSLVPFFRISLECLSCQRRRRPAFHIVTAFFPYFASSTAWRSNRDWSTCFVREIVHVFVIPFLIVPLWSDIPFIIYRSIFQLVSFSSNQQEAITVMPMDNSFNRYLIGTTSTGMPIAFSSTKTINRQQKQLVSTSQVFQTP